MKIAFVTALIAAANGEAVAADCPKIFSCGGGNGCIADAACNWCAGKIATAIGTSVNTSLKLGYCTTATEGCTNAAPNFGTLKAMYGDSFDVETIAKGGKCLDSTSTALDAPNSLVQGKKTCNECKDEANHWCQIDTANAHGGVCLSNARSSVTCADLKKSLPYAYTTKITSNTCPTETDCSKTSNCSACTKNCVWCGIAVEDTKLTTSGSKIVPLSGTQVGQCVQKATAVKDDACAAVKPDAFGTIAKTLEYTKDKHEYKMVAKVLTTTDAVANGWASGADCKDTTVDPLATEKKTCKDCTAAKAFWCQTTLDGKAAGGICLGNDSNAKPLCDELVKAKTPAFHEVKVETSNKCKADAAFSVASASSVALLAAVVAAFVSVA